MHLTSLTLKGFKSFASPTTLRFEPGITCVVGPNGSGKSNVVDAVAWVLGEQGAKTLRGGTMADVVFAGTPGRPALGRAEVTLTIDNSDGALPVDHAEVQVRRLMFRSGESEYAINGGRCRLVDVQELMGDSGIGRELHVVVGQGQLDAVLSARPQDRRAFVEEAAGVLKHNKRKEKALRTLSALQADLTRLSDLTAELQRQLGPLGRQAEAARRAGAVQADLRDARLRLLADDLVQLRERLAVHDSSTAQQRAGVAAELARVQAREAALHADLAASAPRLARAQDALARLSRLEERLRGTATLAAERARHLAAPLPERAGRDPDLVDGDAAQARAQEGALAARLAEARERLRAAAADRTAAETALAVEERALVAAERAVADRREGLARLAGSVGALRSRAAGADAELARLSGTLEEVRARARTAAADLDALRLQADGLEAGEVDLDGRHEAACRALAAAEEQLLGLRAEEQDAERDRATWSARRDALTLSLDRRDGAGALLGGNVPGVLGSVAALVEVEPGAEAAVAAALGVVAEAVAVASPAPRPRGGGPGEGARGGGGGAGGAGAPGAAAAGAAARGGAAAAVAGASPADAARALVRLKDAGGGRAGLVVLGPPGDQTGPRPVLPEGARWALDLVQASAPLRPALARVLCDVVVVDTLEQARPLAELGLRAATVAGDLLGADWAVGGSASTPSLLEVQAAAEQATARADQAQARAEALRAELAPAQAAVAQAQTEVEAALARLHDSDARLAALTERLGQLSAASAAAQAEAQRLEAARERAQAARERDLEGLADLEHRLAAASAPPPADDLAEPSAHERDRLAAAAADARATEVEARLALRTAEERARALTGRADALERAAQAERAARVRLAALLERRSRDGALAGQVVQGAQVALSALTASLRLAEAERDAASAERSGSDAEVQALRGSARQLAVELERLTAAVHREQVARTEQRLRVEALEVRAVQEWSVPVDRLLAEHGPDVPVPTGDGEAVRYDRRVQQQRADTAQRALGRLGRVNPLALEEYTALQERAAFLSAQLADVQATRRDLLTVVREVDERVHEVFAAAFQDTAREFEGVFATLFPGGEGRLVLTDPGDLLTTGIEVLARPAGKRVSRLSLLSGGERSLTALALLVAIFRARPSPFYVLDEVEAALDDRNLGRLLELLNGLRDSSQLIVITHQKRTMEIADALYGVTMRDDGVSAVVGQRLRQRVA